MLDHYDEQQARCYFVTARCVIEPDGPALELRHSEYELLGCGVELSDYNVEIVGFHGQTAELIWYYARPVHLNADLLFDETEPFQRISEPVDRDTEPFYLDVEPARRDFDGVESPFCFESCCYQV